MMQPPLRIECYQAYSLANIEDTRSGKTPERRHLHAWVPFVRDKLTLALDALSTIITPFPPIVIARNKDPGCSTLFDDLCLFGKPPFRKCSLRVRGFRHTIWINVVPEKDYG